VEFYLGFYDLLEEYLIGVIEEVKGSRKVIIALTTKILSLIPRKDNIESFEDFRPISLYIIVYIKYWEKYWQSRLKKLLGGI
jgi:hypothetical protein